MSLWLVAFLLLWPVVIAMGLGVFIVRKAMRWRLPVAITELRVGGHHVLVVRTDLDLSAPGAFESLHRNLVILFAAKGVTVPILLFDRRLDFAVAGPGVADAHQQVPA